ncbi:MAG TPA: hypothetical protein VGH54_21480 [Mycobacterium sp.]|jgi:hypothetical protein|uniref:hypothetical protein n=1 Tax=Mycobacterium sp. TaxID=1785 RepID=UPI002F42089D
MPNADQRNTVIADGRNVNPPGLYQPGIDPVDVYQPGIPDAELVVPVVDAILDFTRAAECLHERCPAFCPCIADYPRIHAPG